MRIRTRIISAALAVVTIANVLYLGYFIEKESVDAHSRLHATMEENNNLLQVVMAGPLYDGNVEQLNINLDSFFRNPDMVAITLIEFAGDITLTRERTVPDGAGQRLNNSVIILRGIDQLGEIRTTYTTANIDQRLAVTRNEMMLLSLLSLLGLALVIYFVAKGLIRPIDRLTEAARTMADGKLDQVIDTAGAEELQVLGQSFVRMRDAIREKIDDLAQNNARLSEEISQRREAEQDRDRLVSILEATTDIVSMADPQGRIIYLNRAGQALLGVNNPTQLEKVIPQLHPQWAVERILNEGIPAAVRDGVWSGESALLGRNDEEIPVSQVILSHKDEHGKVLYMSTIMRDTTERKQAERILQNLNEELENRVEQRTAELAAAKEEAERANLAKSDFLSRMSHELRTPLNAILGFSQLLTNDPEYPLHKEQEDYVQEILLAGSHLLELINEVLDLARIEAGRLSISHESVLLTPLLEECVNLIRPIADTRNIRILAIDPDCGNSVRADRTRLKQVLLNLLSNAVKYNRERGNVNINCKPLGAEIQIRITDSGAGLTEAQQARLFVPFDRLDVDQAVVEGTGIGLALSKRLMELMHGEIGVESTPGVGSTFWVKLPADEAREQDSTRHGLPESAAMPDHTAAAQQCDVLCIEDNPANLRLVEVILARRKNIRLLSASTPGLGLELAQVHHPALILLDINLPDMDGYAVMECLRTSEMTRHIPVVAISANAMPKDLAQGKAAGFTDYLTKPLNVDRVLKVVDEILASKLAGQPHHKV